MKPHRSKARTLWPEEFSLDETRMATGVRILGGHKDVVSREWDHFESYHRMQGSDMADWDAAWRYWLHNSTKRKDNKFLPARPPVQIKTRPPKPKEPEVFTPCPQEVKDSLAALIQKMRVG